MRSAEDLTATWSLAVTLGVVVACGSSEADTSQAKAVPGVDQPTSTGAVDAAVEARSTDGFNLHVWDAADPVVEPDIPCMDRPVVGCPEDGTSLTVFSESRYRSTELYRDPTIGWVLNNDACDILQGDACFVLRFSFDPDGCFVETDTTRWHDTASLGDPSDSLRCLETPWRTQRWPCLADDVVTYEEFCFQ